MKSNNEDYNKAKEYGLTNLNRWEDGIEHHEKTKPLKPILNPFLDTL